MLGYDGSPSTNPTTAVSSPNPDAAPKDGDDNPVETIHGRLPGSSSSYSDPVLQLSGRQGIYYDYILFPRLKAEDHYIAPTRWQDFAFQAVFWTVALLALFAAFRLIRFALRTVKPL